MKTAESTLYRAAKISIKALEIVSYSRGNVFYDQCVDVLSMYFDAVLKTTRNARHNALPKSKREYRKTISHITE